MQTAVPSLVRGAEWQSPIPPEDRDYPYNGRWVAAFSHGFGADLLGRWLRDTPVLLYRSEKGQVIVFESRCLHLGAPLSLGCRKGQSPHKLAA
jgi:hypothetical protein